MYESEVITFVAPKKSGWLKKKSKGRLKEVQGGCCPAVRLAKDFLLRGVY